MCSDSVVVCEGDGSPGSRASTTQGVRCDGNAALTRAEVQRLQDDATRRTRCCRTTYKVVTEWRRKWPLAPCYQRCEGLVVQARVRAWSDHVRAVVASAALPPRLAIAGEC